MSAPGRTGALKPGLERRLCQPPAVGATVNQNWKWKFRISRGGRQERQGWSQPTRIGQMPRSPRMSIA